MLRAAELVETRASKATKNICPHWQKRAIRHVARNVDMECSKHPWDSLESDTCETWDRYVPNRRSR